MAGSTLAPAIAAVAAAVAFAGAVAAQDRVRIATFNASLSRGGPGVLLKDIQAGDDPQITAVAEIIRTVRPDILLLNEFDYDGGDAALAAFAALLAQDGAAPGIDYTHRFSAPSNTGQPSGLDLNGDGSTLGPEDAWGFGRFPGQYGMAMLSRFPIDPGESRSFRLLRWADVPDALLPRQGDAPFPSAAAQAAMRLSSKSHWDLAITLPRGSLRVLASHPTPPVFDGPEDANGRRNHDEIVFWARYLDGWAVADDAGRTAPIAAAPVVVLGDLNADPRDGDGRHDGIFALLRHPRLQDPAPSSIGGAVAAAEQGGLNARHRGDPALDTADWRDDSGPGNLRVDYVLPDAALTVLDAGVFWPEPGALGAEWVGSGRVVSSDHRLVWVDITQP
ncbi:MAG: endonuclease/exonuclease/phosphatase family protein [Pseudomonadota bacterium]